MSIQLKAIDITVIFGTVTANAKLRSDRDQMDFKAEISVRRI